METTNLYVVFETADDEIIPIAFSSIEDIPEEYEGDTVHVYEQKSVQCLQVEKKLI